MVVHSHGNLAGLGAWRETCFGRRQWVIQRGTGRLDIPCKRVGRYEKGDHSVAVHHNIIFGDAQLEIKVIEKPRSRASPGPCPNGRAPLSILDCVGILTRRTAKEAQSAFSARCLRFVVVYSYLCKIRMHLPYDLGKQGNTNAYKYCQLQQDP